MTSTFVEQFALSLSFITPVCGAVLSVFEFYYSHLLQMTCDMYNWWHLHWKTGNQENILATW